MRGAVTADDVRQQYITRLEKENRQLQETNQQNIIIFEKRVAVLEQKNRILEEKLKLALFRQFGRHAEKFTGPGQILLFEGGEEAASKTGTAEKEIITVRGHRREKRGRKPLADNLPREHRYLDIAEEEKQCGCGHDLVCIGEEVSERLHIIPQQVYVEVLHRKKYACHECEGSGDEDAPAVRMAAAASAIMPGSIATPGLLSFIFTQKYCDYLPYYRQEAAFRRIGVDLSRQNMANWQQKVCEKLRPLLTILKGHIKTGNVVQMDETTMQVMEEPGRGNKQKSYMWLARGGPPDKKAVWYEYHESRASKHILELLSGYTGFLQTDGYEAYDAAVKDLPGIIHAGCFAHARRGFFESMKAGGSGGAEAALAQIKGLYTVERELRNRLTDKEIDGAAFQRKRKEKSLPILNAFHQWLERERGQVLGSSKLGEAVAYTINQWPKLIRYLEDGELTPDNNACERSIRPFVMGRRNWVLSGSPAGAQSSCQLYSLIETAKVHGRNPYEYLKRVFEQAAVMKPADDWGQLLPWNLTP
jgi:transposase